MANVNVELLNMDNDADVPPTNPQVAQAAKHIPVLDTTSGEHPLQKVSLEALQSHIIAEAPFVTDTQMRVVTDDLASAIRSLSNRVAQVEASGGGTGGGTGGGGTPTPTGGGGQVLFGLWDTSAAQPSGTVHRQDYQGLPATVTIQFGPNPSDDIGFYVQVPSGVTIASFINVTLPSQRERSSAWTHVVDDNRWWLGSLPANVSVIYELSLQSTGQPQTGGGQQQGGGQQPPPQRPSVPGQYGAMTYGRIDAQGAPQGTALTQQIAALPATFSSVQFPGGEAETDGWYITEPTGVRVASIQHRRIDGQLQDVTALWTYDASSRTHSRYGQLPGVPGVFTITVEADGG